MHTKAEDFGSVSPGCCRTRFPGSAEVCSLRCHFLIQGDVFIAGLMCKMGLQPSVKVALNPQELLARDNIYEGFLGSLP